MAKTVYEIAEEALPGWRVVRGEKPISQERKPRAQFGTADLAELRRRYLGETTAGSEGFQPASSLSQNEDVDYIVMEPGGANPGERRRVVVVSNGKAVAVQG